MIPVYFESGGAWSKGGGSLLRNLSEVVPASAPHGVPIIARHVVPRPLLRTGKFLVMPQNALPWVTHRSTRSEAAKTTAMLALSEVAMARTRLLIRISEAIPERRIRPSTEVLHNVLDAAFEDCFDGSTPVIPGGPFLACVGSLHSYRNVSRLVQAHQRYRRAGGQLRLVVIGWPHPQAGPAIIEAAQGGDGSVYVISKEVPRAGVLATFADAVGLRFASRS